MADDILLKKIKEILLESWLEKKFSFENPITKNTFDTLFSYLDHVNLNKWKWNFLLNQELKKNG